MNKNYSNLFKTIKQRLEKLEQEGEKSFLAGTQWRVLHGLEQLACNKPELKIDEELIYRLLHPSRLAEVNFAVEFGGKTYMCIGVRAWFDNGKYHQPGQIVKGGIRFLSTQAKNVNQKLVTIGDEEKARTLMFDDVMALGLEMLAKNAGTNFFKNVLVNGGLIKRYKVLTQLGIVGGAKGVIIAPRDLHLPDHNQFVKKALEEFGYRLGLLGIVGWDRDVPAGDIGTTGTVAGSSVLDGFVDGYARSLKDIGLKKPRNLLVGVCTGKTANKKYLGNLLRPVATGFGTVEALRIWAKSKGKNLKDLIVVFDGAGNAALPAAKFLVNSGIKVVGMTDSRSASFYKEGFNIKDLEQIGQFKSERKSLGEWVIKSKKGINFMRINGELNKAKLKLWQKSNMNVLFVSSDAMIINKNNVDSLPQNLLIIDGANGPVTPLAEKKLAAKRIDHLTGSYANSGGVIGSLIEWSANVADINIDKKETKKLIKGCMEANFQAMKRLVDQKIVSSLGEAFYYMAMERFLKK